MSGVAIKKTRADYIFDIFNMAFLGIITLIILYPLYFVVIASFSDPSYVASGQVWFYPVGITFDGYARAFKDPNIFTGYMNSALYTLVGTSLSLLITLPLAYAVSRKGLRGRKLLSMLIVFTMIFHAGMVPRYMLVKDIGLLNSFWAMVLPNMIVVYNMIVARTFFENSMPDELYEAAQIDGCGHARYFVSVVLPLSGALIAVMVLFYGVQNWNAYFDALLFISKKELAPLQLVLRDILIASKIQSNSVADMESADEYMKIAEQLKYGVIIIASLPMMLLYPFMQKYFVSGVMLGAVKG